MSVEQYEALQEASERQHAAAAALASVWTGRPLGCCVPAVQGLLVAPWRGRCRVGRATVWPYQGTPLSSWLLPRQHPDELSPAVVSSGAWRVTVPWNPWVISSW